MTQSDRECGIVRTDFLEELEECGSRPSPLARHTGSGSPIPESRNPASDM